MIKRHIYIPNIILKDLYNITQREQYVALYDTFPESIDDKIEYLFLSYEEAKNLIALVNIEREKVLLKFPYHDSNHPKYEPNHEYERESILIDLWEKVHFFLNAEMEQLKQATLQFQKKPENKRIKATVSAFPSTKNNCEK